ncbi:hypothetical protein IG631_04769 [Alternaria alternata]|nr:hypothetical protein IG631_04769 [Alternaria alternata]
MITYVDTQIKPTTPTKSLLPVSFLQDLSISFPTPASHPSYNSLLNQRSHNAPTSTAMSRSLARRIPDDVWNFHKATIRELYIVEDRKLDGYDGVMDIMTKRYDFSPTLAVHSKSQYEKKIALWNMRKKITDRERNAILPRVQQRADRGRQTHLVFNGVRVDEKRIGRELDRRRSNSSMRDSFLQATEPTTPPGFAIQSPPSATDVNEDDLMSNSWSSVLGTANDDHHASSPEPQAAPKDTSTSFLKSYYCVHCGEGPYHISRSPYCPECFPYSNESQYQSYDCNSTGKSSTIHELIDPKYSTPYRQPYGYRRYRPPLIYL